LLPASAGKKQKWSGEKVTADGRVDWRQGIVYAIGHGAIDRRNPNQAKAYLRAREYAKIDALANLLMAVDHIRIDARTIGRDFEADTTIRAELQGIVRGAEVIDERKLQEGGDTIVEVTVSTPMYGERSIASVLIPEVVEREEVAGSDPEPALPPIKVKIVPKRETLPAPRAPRASAAVTSVIIDVRGLGVERGMCPKIRRPDGSEVWGTVSADPDFVIEHGIAVYAHSLAQAQNDARAGNNPLIIRATGRAGNRFNTDAVISDDDAERLLEADQVFGFLGKYRVIFVVDANK
jgi:hypothetical protein